MARITAPAGLYTFDRQTGRAVPIIAVNEDGYGLTPGGATTKQIHMIGAPQGDPDTADQVQARTNRNDYMAAVRQAEQNCIPPCPHGEPRGHHNSILVRCTTCNRERLYSLDRSLPDEDPCDCRPLYDEQAVLPIDDDDPGGPHDA